MFITGKQSYPTVSVVVPAMNEAENLQYVLPRIPPWVHEILLVDGHSSDDTVEVAKRIIPGIRVLNQDGKGKGNALRTGFDNANGDIIIMLDSDGSMSPAEIPAYVGALMAGADFAKGSRFLHGGGTDDMEIHRYWGNFGFVMLVRILFGGRYSDLCYGYCGFWRYVLPLLDLSSDGFEIETEIYARALRIGLKVIEVPSFEYKRKHGKSNLRAFPDGWRVLKRIAGEYIRQKQSGTGIWNGLLTQEDIFTPAMNLLLEEALHLRRRRAHLSSQAYHHAVESIKSATSVLLSLESNNPRVIQQQAQHIQNIETMWSFLEADLQSP